MLEITLKAISRTITITRIRYSMCEMYSEHNGERKHIKYVPWITYMVIEKDHCNEISMRYISEPAFKNQLNKTLDFWKRQYGGRIIYKYRNRRKDEKSLSK